MLTATVQYCGAGGTSEGARQAGIHVEAAINHSKIAIASHEANHPNCIHYQQWIEEINPDDTPDSDFLLTSPCCTNHTNSKGQKHYHQFDLWGDIVFDPLAEKSRNTMEDVVRFAKAKYNAGKPYKCIVVENVVEVAKWRKYHSWLASMTTLDIPGLDTPIYEYQALYWNTQFFGVPQSRDRVYIVFWLRGLPAPDLEHRPAAFCEYCEKPVQAVQSRKQGLRWGNYREQYNYNCPHCNHEIIPPHTPTRSILDLDNLGRPIKDRLKPNIRQNIAMGLKFLPRKQFLYSYYGNPGYRLLDEPVGTITTVDRWALITPANCVEETLHRMLTPEEVQRVMGFPEEYQILGTKRQRIWQMGNAVCPPIMADILRRSAKVIVSGGSTKSNMLLHEKGAKGYITNASTHGQ